jgi:uncharacterized membrane protein YgdD (TMEM256/DUF423 family)
MNTTSKRFLYIGVLLGGLAVILGAFGSHAFEAILLKNQKVEVYKLASQYQYYHTFAILSVGILMLHFQNRYLVYAGYAFLMGVIIFSGSLYVLALSNIRWLGAITPLGGISLILGWFFLWMGIYQSEK